MSSLLDIARQFDVPIQVNSVVPFGSGLINNTYLCTSAEETGVSSNSGISELSKPEGKAVVLQQINKRVFNHPQQVMHNIVKVVDHVKTRVQGSLGPVLKMPEIYRALDGQYWFTDDSDNTWRAMEFLSGTVSFDIAKNMDQASQAGVLLGLFHSLVCEIPSSSLNDTLPGFHQTPLYLKSYDKTLAANTRSVDADIRYCMTFIDNRRPLMTVLEDARSRMNTRIIHGDPKFNNFLFDQHSGNAVSLIDLDTVKPGLIHYDIGDCLRSCCNTAGEMPDNIEDVVYDLEICSAILKGYAQHAVNFLTAEDFELMFDAMMLLPLELGLRFFTDYLDGNRYFKVSSESDNLRRALVQFKLVDEIEKNRITIARLISDLQK